MSSLALENQPDRYQCLLLNEKIESNKKKKLLKVSEPNHKQQGPDSRSL